MQFTGTHARHAPACSRGLLVIGALRRTVRQRMGYDAAHTDSDGGFTLIEAIVSFVIFAVVTAAAVLAIITGVAGANANRDRVDAANVAAQEVARAQAMPLASLTSTPSATSTSTVGKEAYTIARTITYSTGTACPSALTSGTPHTVNVQVVVTWPGSNTRKVEMDTVRTC